jgi:hypothetical protein
MLPVTNIRICTSIHHLRLISYFKTRFEKLIVFSVALQHKFEIGSLIFEVARSHTIRHTQLHTR